MIAGSLNRLNKKGLTASGPSGPPRLAKTTAMRRPDPDFSGVYESGIMLTIGDLIDSKRQRYIDPYIAYLKQLLNEKRAAHRAAKIAKGKDDTPSKIKQLAQEIIEKTKRDK